jgi:cytochrome P450
MRSRRWLACEWTVRSIKDLPGPPRLPVLGNAHQVRTSTLHSVAERWCERYGPVFRFDLGPRRIVCIGELETINAVLRDRPQGFRRWRELKERSDEGGMSGVFVAEGDEWRRQRRLAVTALNSNHLSRYFHIVRTSTERLYRRLKDEALHGRPFDIAQELASYTVDITSALAFGHDLNTLERRNNQLQEHIQRVIQTGGRRLVAPVPYWRWIPLPADRVANRSLEAVRRAVEQFIEQARARRAANPQLDAAPENFLEAMLAAQASDGTFTDDEIIGNTFTMLLAGEDTTAHTMAWTVWWLARTPQVQMRCAQEATAVLNEDRFALAHETTEQLRYCEAVLRESLRLKPVAPFISAEPLADTTLAGTHIPAGTRLLLLTRYATMRGGGFERAAEFDPQRWLDRASDSAPAEHDPRAFLPFGAGPRFCPGRNLALLESKCALAMIARNFDVTLDQSQGPVSERLVFTMVPQGLRVRLHERGLAERGRDAPSAVASR